MKNFIFIILLSFISLSINSQSFTVGAEVGYSVVNNTHETANFDFNIIGSHYETWVGIGIISDNDINGWGRRLSIGHMLHPTISLQASISRLDQYESNLTTTSLGIDVGWQCWKGLHLCVGLDNERGGILRLRYLNWKQNDN